MMETVEIDRTLLDFLDRQIKRYKAEVVALRTERDALRTRLEAIERERDELRLRLDALEYDEAPVQMRMTMRVAGKLPPAEPHDSDWLDEELADE